MPRILRLVFAAALAFLLAFAQTRPALAGEAPEIGELPARDEDSPETKPEKKPAAIEPHDVPVVVAAAQEIPPVPTSYVTRHLGWLTLSYPAQAEERVAGIVRDADAIKQQLTEALGQPVLAELEVRVTPTVADMRKLAPSNAPPPDYASGVAYSQMHLVLVSMLAPRGAEAVDVDETFRHELAHVALEDATLGRHVPVWFNEGLAIALSDELVWARRKTLASATLSGTLIPLADLDRNFPHENHEVSVAYAEAADFMQFLQRNADHARFLAMIERVRDGQTFDRAITEAYGSDLRKLEFQWRGDLERRFSIIPALTGGGLIWVLVVVALVLAYVRRRRRARAILERWAHEEAIEDALAAKKAALERAGEGSAFRPLGVPAPPSKVEHGGRWHTLH